MRVVPVKSTVRSLATIPKSAVNGFPKGSMGMKFAKALQRTSIKAEQGFQLIRGELGRWGSTGLKLNLSLGSFVGAQGVRPYEDPR